MASCTVSFKPIDPKRDEFRRYLERAGVIEALTKVVIRIVKERPENPLEYLRTNLCDAKHEADEYAYLQKELQEARSEIKRLREVIAAADPTLLDEKPVTATTNANESKQPLADSGAAPEEKNSKEISNESTEEKDNVEKSDAQLETKT